MNVLSGEDFIHLSWEETKLGINYSLGYGIQGNMTYTEIDYSIMPDSTAFYLIDSLSPGVTYILQLDKDGERVFTSSQTTSRLQ